MFGEFLNIIFKSIKLDKSLYSDNKNFGEASIYFAGLIMIFDGIAGAVAAKLTKFKSFKILFRFYPYPLGWGFRSDPIWIF